MNNIKILGKDYKITKSKNSFDGDIGQADAINCEIKIMTEMSNDRKNETILHEIIHILSYDLKIELNETQTTVLGAGIYSVLIDNGFKIDFKV